MDDAISYPPVRGDMPSGVRLALVLGLPFLGAVTVTGIFLGQELVVAAAWIGMLTAAVIFVEPLIGVVALTGGLLLAAYPTLLQDFGFITLGNLFGVCLAVQLVVYVLGTRDLSFLKIPQVLIMAGLGVLFVVSVVHADAIFPLLQVTRGRGGPRSILDKTPAMMNNVWTRLALLVFICVFVRKRRDVRVLFVTFMIVLYLAIPSAIVNWMRGELLGGFRAAASLTAGNNSNRLALICLVQITCWWFWSLARPTVGRRLCAAGVVLTAIPILFATGSRSGLLGAGFLVLLLQTGPRQFRVPTPQVGLLVLIAVLSITLLAPTEAWDRMVRFSTEDPHAPGYTSSVKREATVTVGWQMFRDHWLLGVGLGNFQEVARQIYDDEYYRPPHNSYIWAAAEGGVLCVGGYFLLFWITWRELMRALALAARDRELALIAAALRVVFLLGFFFSAFADLWLTPITYVLVGLTITLRRYLESVPVAHQVPAAAERLALAVAR